MAEARHRTVQAEQGELEVDQAPDRERVAGGGEVRRVLVADLPDPSANHPRAPKGVQRGSGGE